MAPLAPHALVVVPLPFALSTADVYREADRLGLPRSRRGSPLRGTKPCWRALAPGGRLPERLLVNDLEPAAVSLCPAIEGALVRAP